MVFSSVIVRVGQGVSQGDTDGKRAGMTSVPGRTTYASTHFGNPTYGEGVQISLQKMVHTHTDGDDGQEMKMRIDSDSDTNV